AARRPPQTPGGVREFDLAAKDEPAPCDLAGESLERPIEHVALGEALADAVRRVDSDRVRLPQRQQPETVIEIPVGEQDRRNRRVARPAWVQRGKALNLGPDLR